jgi:aminomethyltransferase
LPLHALHEQARAHFQPFAGWMMPIQYPTGLLAEHRHTRAAASLFDVSHMGQICVRARSGRQADAARALERLMPVDLLSLSVHRQRYALLTTPSGGVLDDLMIVNLGDCFVLVVNAACATADLAHLEAQLADECEVYCWTDRVLLALHGPRAAATLARRFAGSDAMKFMDALPLAGAADTAASAASVAPSASAGGFLTRSGYTGEDGFEISLPAPAAADWVDALFAAEDVRWAGLGARDSLRLEAGLCLYGHELTPDITPVEAGLGWALPSVRRAGGVRAGGYPGHAVIAAQLADGVARQRVGLRADSRPVREGALLYTEIADAATTAAGRVTSGTFGPTAQAPVAMGYVAAGHAAVGTRLVADVRGQRIPVTVSRLPFVPHRYHR